MDALDDQALAEIQTRIAARMVTEFGLGLSGLALDMTNFATFIDSANDKAPIAQLGHTKQKRTDLRLVGMGMVVSRDGAVPLIGHAYPGNRPDVAVFPTVVDELVSRYRALAAEDTELTVVFDAGQNSAANFAHFTETGLHFVGSLPLSDHPELLALPAIARPPGRRRALRRAGRLRHADHRAGRRPPGDPHPLPDPGRQTGRRVRPDPGQGQPALGELAATLERGKTRRDRAGVQAAIAKITRPRWINLVLTTTLTGTTPDQMRLSATIDTPARAELETELFGTRLLVTDREDWTIAEVVAAYRSQNDAEQGFRQLKDPTWSTSPRCSTGPTRKSGCTSSTAYSPSPSRTRCAATPRTPDYP